MTMTRSEEGILFAWALAAAAGKAVAIYLDHTGVKAAAVDTATTSFEARSALVNLLRHGLPGRNGMVCMSEAPSELDQGIFQMNAAQGGLHWATASSLYKGSVNNFTWTAATVQPGGLGDWLRVAAPQRSNYAKRWCARNRLDKQPLIPPQTSNEVSNLLGRVLRDAPFPRLRMPEMSEIPGYHVTPLSEAILMSLAYGIVRLSWSDEAISNMGHKTPSNPQGGHNIACVIVDGNGRIIGWGRNHNATNATLHGEVMAILNYQLLDGGPLPEGSRIYTTLKPCYMCAGTLVTAAPGCTVVSGQDDVNIVNSALDRQVNRCRSEVRAHENTGIKLLAIQGNRSTTGSLATAAAQELMEDALFEFFYIGFNLRADCWESQLWEQGMELLRSISPHVDTLRFYMFKGLSNLPPSNGPLYPKR